MRTLSLSPRGPTRDSQMLRIIIILVVLAVLILAFALQMMIGPRTPDPFLPNLPARHGFQVLKVPNDVTPGIVRPEMEFKGLQLEISGDQDVKVHPVEAAVPQAGETLKDAELKRLAGRTGDGSTVTLRPEVVASLDAVGQVTKPPVAVIQPKVVNDLYDNPTPDYHLRAEYQNSERVPVDPENPEGPAIEPRMMETPWLAFESLLGSLAGLGQQVLEANDNGDAFFEASTPSAVEYLRGRVFTRKGTLWLLRKTPLRKPLLVDGVERKEAWFGILSYLRKGLAGEPHWVNESLAFTVLDLPEELQKIAAGAGSRPSNQDAFATGGHWVELRGVYFRRVYYAEPIEGLDLSHLTDVAAAARETWTEAVLPWLVGTTITPVEAEWPSLETMKGIVDEYSEAMTRFRSSSDLSARRDRFDEAGYYLLLQAVQQSDSPFQSLESTALTFRSLLDAPMRSRYRGAKVAVQGLLQDQYFPYVLPPNISGRRYVYRTFVLDADDLATADESLQWYVDLLEPPLQFRGRVSVRAEGFYYRSQEFAANVGGTARVVSYPLVIAPRLNHGEVKKDSPLMTVGPVTLVVVVGGVLLVVVLLMLSGQRDRRRRETFERETLRHVRERMKRARESGGGPTLHSKHDDPQDQ